MPDPYRRIRFDPDRVGWMGLLLALPVPCFTVGTLVALATGCPGYGLDGPRDAQASCLTVKPYTTFDGGFHVGLMMAALLTNLFAVLAGCDTRLNLAIAGLVAATLAIVAGMGWLT